MILKGDINEMIELFDLSIAIRFYKQVDSNLFDVHLRSTVPNTINTVKKLKAYLSKINN